MTDIPSNPAVVTLTPRAVQEVRALQARADNAGKTLRVYVEQGGCSGMQYGLVFDEPREGDEQTRVEDVQALIDAFSAKYVRGSVVDFSDSPPVVTRRTSRQRPVVASVPAALTRARVRPSYIAIGEPQGRGLRVPMPRKTL